MADPVTIALTVGATIMSAVGQIQQGQAQKQQADYQAAVARNNEQIANNYAKMDMDKAAQDQQNQDMKTKAMVGNQLSAQGASGLDVGSGSLVDVRTSSAELGKLDSLTAYNNGEKTAYGDKVKATNFAADAQLDKTKGENSMLAGYIGAGSSILGGASSVSSKWSTYSRLGYI